MEISTTADIRLAKRAIRERWPIPQATRDSLGIQLAGIINNEEVKASTRVSAAKTLMQMDSLNLKEQIAYAPRIVANITDLSDEELNARLNLLQSEVAALPEVSEIVLYKSLMAEWVPGENNSYVPEIDCYTLPG